MELNSEYYKLKFLKYKNKYTNLKVQLAGAIENEPNTHNEYVCVSRHAHEKENELRRTSTTDQIIQLSRLSSELAEIKTQEDIPKLIGIMSNKDLYDWVTTQPVSAKLKCKHFGLDKRDVLMVFENKQRRTGKIFTNLTEAIESYQGNPKYFTFIISTAGVKYGAITDGLEAGVSHLHLVESMESNENVVVAGEIKFSDGELFYNFSSGTYTAPQSLDKSKYEFDTIKYRMLCETVFRIKSNQHNQTETIKFNTIKYNSNSEASVFPSKVYPSREELQDICAQPNIQVFEGIDSLDPKTRCTTNSITILENKEIKNAYQELGKKLMEKERIPDTKYYQNICNNLAKLST